MSRPYVGYLNVIPSESEQKDGGIYQDVEFQFVEPVAFLFWGQGLVPAGENHGNDRYPQHFTVDVKSHFDTLFLKVMDNLEKLVFAFERFSPHEDGM